MKSFTKKLHSTNTNIHIYVGMFVAVFCFLVISQTVHAAVTITGSLYENNFSTKITSGKTITAAVATSTPSLHSATSNGSGNYTISIPTSNPGETWTDGTAAGDNDYWESVTYGNGTFVAVAGDFSGDKVMTSTNGTSWTTRTAAINRDWQGVAYGNGLFVAVSCGSTSYSCNTTTAQRVMTSTDGTTWTARDAAGNNDSWQSVTYGNGTFVAVGYNGDLVMTSTDGTSWTAQSAAGDNDSWQSVTYGNGLFVAVGHCTGSNDCVMTSTDGTSWTAQSAVDDNDSWQDVTYGDGTFVAVGTAGDRVMTSTNGTSWTARSAAGDNDGWYGVTYSSGTFVAVGSGGGSDYVMTSTNGTAWTARSAAGDNDSWRAVTSGNGVFVAVGYSATDIVMTASAVVIDETVPITLYVNNDGSVKASTLLRTSAAYPSPNNIHLIRDSVNLYNNAYDISTPITMLEDGIYDYSDDTDILITISTSTDSFSLGSVSTSSDLFISNSFAVDDVISPYSSWYVYGDFTNSGGAEMSAKDIYVSGNVTYSNGIPNLPNTTFYLTGASSIISGNVLDEYNIGNFVLSGETTITGTTTVGSVEISEGATLVAPQSITITGNLTQNGTLDITSSSTELSLNGSSQIVSGSDLDFGGAITLAGSSDFATTSAAGNNDYWVSVVYAEGIFVAVGDSAGGDRIMTSPDGVNWTVRSTVGNGIRWNDVTYGNGVFVAVGEEQPGTYDGFMYSEDGITWATTTSGSAYALWETVVYGGGKFVAIAPSGNDWVAYSTDGITWATSTPIAGLGSPYDIEYANGTYVVVADTYSGTYDAVMTSSDAITWTLRTGAAGDNDNWRSVTYGKGLFVAVSRGSADEVMTSPDGITWTARSAPTSNWNDVAYIDGQFIAVADSGDYLMTSPDGITWTVPYDVPTGGWNAVTAGGGATVVVGDGGTGRVMISESTVAFTSNATSTDVVVGGGAELVGPNYFDVEGDFSLSGLLDFTSSSTVLSMSGGAQTMTGNFTGSSTLGDLVVNSGATVTGPEAIDLSGDFAQNGTLDFSTENTILTLTGSGQTLSGTYTGTSSLGSVLVEGTNPTFSSNASTTSLTIDTGASMTGPTLLGVTGDFIQNGSIDFSGTTLYAGRTLTGAFTGSNALSDVVVDPVSEGTSWSGIDTSELGTIWNDITYGEGKFVGVGNGTNDIMSSTDGESWTGEHTMTAFTVLQGVTHGNGKFVAVGPGSGASHPATSVSDDGESWTNYSALGDNDSWQDVVYADGTFVAVGILGDRVMTSTNGTSWTARSAAGDNDNWYGVTYGNGKFVAVGGDYGSNDSIMYSTDGTSWSTATSPAGVYQSWEGVTYGNGKFVAVGRAGSGNKGVMTSTDGISWTVISAAEDDDFWSSVTYANGLFVAVADSGDDRIMTSPDGETWTTYSVGDDNDQWQSIVYGNKQYVGIGNGYSGDTVMVSDKSLTAATIEVNDMTILPATSFTSTSTVTIAGDYNNDGTLTASTSEFIFAGTSQQTATGTLDGTSAFYDLTLSNTSQDGDSNQSVIFGAPLETSGTLKMRGGTSAQFLAGATSTVQNVDLKGTSNDAKVWLRSSSDGNDWSLDVPGDQINVYYVDVKDSYASSTITASRSTDSTGNTNWEFITGPTYWNSTDWKKYDEITIDADNVDSNLTDFPVYIDLGGLSEQFWSTVADGGDDIRVVTNDLDTELPREVVSAVTASDTGELYFKTDLSSTVDNVFRIYYNGSTTVEYAATSTYGSENVWSNDYVGVYHFDSGATDSTSNGFDGTVTGATLQSGGGYVFTSTDRITISNSVSPYIQANGDMTALIDSSNDWSTINGAHIFDNRTGTSNGWDLEFTSGNLELTIDTGTSVTPSGDAGSGTGVRYVRGSYDGANARVYATSSSVSAQSAKTGSATQSNATVLIGNQSTFTEPLGSGRILDEFRISSSTRSAAWIQTEYLNMTSTSTFYASADFFEAGSTTIANHDSGQVSNAFNFQNKTNEALFGFNLIPNSGTATVTDLVLSLTGVENVDVNDFSSIRLYKDNDDDAAYDANDEQVGGSGVMVINPDETGTVTFTGDFLSTTTRNYVVVIDWNAPSNGSYMTVDLLTSGVTAVDDNGTQDIYGSVDHVQHSRSNRGGGGSSSSQIGGSPPASPDLGGGEEGGGGDPGEQIGGNPGTKRPSSDAGSWTTGSNAYDQTDGTYATDAAGATHTYSDASLGVAGGVTIDGVEVKMEVSGTTAAGTIDVQLSWDGGTSWTTAKSTATLTTSDVVVTLGGPSDKWGRASWAVTDFSDANFRVRLTGVPSSNTVRVDEIQAKVYSSTGGGGAGGGGDI